MDMCTVALAGWIVIVVFLLYMAFKEEDEDGAGYEKEI